MVSIKGNVIEFTDADSEIIEKLKMDAEQWGTTPEELLIFKLNRHVRMPTPRQQFQLKSAYQMKHAAWRNRRKAAIISLIAEIDRQMNQVCEDILDS